MVPIAIGIAMEIIIALRVNLLSWLVSSSEKQAYFCNYLIYNDYKLQ